MYNPKETHLKNEQLKILLRNKVNVVDAEKDIDRKDNARALVSELLKPHSLRFLIKTCEAMSLYLDFDFVKKALMDFYFKTENIQLKELIKSIHDGTFDDTELREEVEYYTEINKLNQEAYLELLRQREQA
jgi:hypothetical protein